MKFLKKIRALREINSAALTTNQKLLVEAERLGENAEQDREAALVRLKDATDQAERLGLTNSRNHFSESLAHSFRGRTAQ